MKSVDFEGQRPWWTLQVWRNLCWPRSGFGTRSVSESLADFWCNLVCYWVSRSFQEPFYPWWIRSWKLWRLWPEYYWGAIEWQAHVPGQRIDCAVKSETGCRHGGRLTFTYRLFGRAHRPAGSKWHRTDYENKKQNVWRTSKMFHFAELWLLLKM